MCLWNGAAFEPRRWGSIGILIMVIMYWVVPVSGECNQTALNSAVDGILSEYDRDAPPTPLVNVLLSLDVRHAAVDDRTASLRMLADLHMSWEDSRLLWNTSELKCDAALTSAEMLWLPDVELLNAAAGAGVVPLQARVGPDGAVTWVVRLDVSIPITMNLDDWPEDMQTGVFKFASRSKTIDSIDLSNNDEVNLAVFESGSWEMVSVSCSLRLDRVLAGGRGRREAVWLVTLRRRAGCRRLAARVAGVAAALLLLAAGLLPPANRAPLAAAAACVAAFWLCSAVWRLPGGSGVPRALRLCGTLTSTAAAAALFAAVTARLAARSSPPPAALKTLLTNASVVLALLPAPESGSTGGECATWSAAARLLDAVLLAAVGLAILIALCLGL